MSCLLLPTYMKTYEYSYIQCPLFPVNRSGGPFNMWWMYFYIGIYKSILVAGGNN